MAGITKSWKITTTNFYPRCSLAPHQEFRKPCFHGTEISTRRFASATPAKTLSKARSTVGNKTDEETVAAKEVKAKRRSWWANKTEEQKALIKESRAAAMRAFWVNKTDEEKALIVESQATRLRAFWANKTEEQKILIGESRATGLRAFWANQTDDQRAIHAEKVRASWAKRTPEEKRRITEPGKLAATARRAIARGGRKTAQAGKMRHRTAVMRAMWANKTDDQRAIHAEKIRASWAKRTPEEKRRITEPGRLAAAARWAMARGD